MNAGKQVKALREERGLRPSDIERLSFRLAEQFANQDYVIPHGTLNGIEGGATPTIYKLASLAAVLEVGIEQLLLVYGIDVAPRANTQDTGTRIECPQSRARAMEGLSTSELKFPETELVQEDSLIWGAVPPSIRARLGDPSRFSYAIIGSKDDVMWEVLPGGSLVEIDRNQNKITRFPWRSALHRPIYCLWHGEGHVCCWCDQTGNVVTMVPHPLSTQRSRQLRVPRDVTVIGRVTNFWQLAQPGH
jgi:hypothetical protein